MKLIWSARETEVVRNDERRMPIFNSYFVPNSKFFHCRNSRSRLSIAEGEVLGGQPKEDHAGGEAENKERRHFVREIVE